MASYAGVIKARVIEVKFALAGKIASVNKFVGDRVNKWDLLASLDRKVLQTELDRQLADFEKVRADFEIFNQKNPNPIEAVDKYLKTEKQAALNASVKDVEIAKSKLDMVDLLSPVNGIIIDDGGIVPGLNITPSGNLVKVIDEDSFYFEFKIEEKDVTFFLVSQKAEVEIMGKKFTGATKTVIHDGKSFTVRMPLTGHDGLVIGITGSVDFEF